jgi:hypothetical protein
MIVKELTQAHLRRHISTDDLQVGKARNSIVFFIYKKRSTPVG